MKTKIAQLIFSEAMLDTVINDVVGSNGDIQLRRLIEEIHPSWKHDIDGIRIELRELLNIVIADESEKSSWLDNLRKTRISRRKFATLVLILGLSSTMLAGCNPPEAIKETEDNDPRSTYSTKLPSTPTRTMEPSPTQTQTLAPTPTSTREPTPTPFPEGTIDWFIQDIKNLEKVDEERVYNSIDSIELIAVPAEDGGFLRWGESVQKYAFNPNTYWETDKVIIIDKEGKELTLLRVKPQHDSNNILFLVLDEDSTIIEIEPNTISESARLEVNDVSSSMLASLSQTFSMFSNLQAENGSSWISHYFTSVLDQPSLSEELELNLNGEEAQRFVEIINQITQQMSSLENDGTKDFNFDLGITETNNGEYNLILIFSLEKNIPEDQRIYYADIASKIVNNKDRVNINGMEESRVFIRDLNEKEYEEWIHYLVSDPSDITIFTESEDLDKEVQDFIDLSTLINNYDFDSQESVEDYIERAKEENVDIISPRIYEALREYLSSSRKDTLKLAEVLQKNIPEIGIVNTGGYWPEKVYQLYPPRSRYGIDNPEDFPYEPGFRGGAYLYDGVDILGDIPLNMYRKGDLMIIPYSYNPEDPDSDVELIICIDNKRISGENYLLTVIVDSNGKLILFVINSDNEDLFLTGGTRFVIGDLRKIR